MSSERGLVLQSYARAPSWLVWTVGLLFLVVVEPLAQSGLVGEVQVPAWLQTNFGVLVVLSLVLAFVGLASTVAQQLLGEARGELYVGALYSKGLGVRRRFKLHFVPWDEVRSVRQVVLQTRTTTATGATTDGPSLTFYELDCGAPRPVLLRETEGGTETATLIAARAGLEWQGDVAVRPG